MPFFAIPCMQGEMSNDCQNRGRWSNCAYKFVGGGGVKSEMPFYFLSLIMLFNSHTAAIAAGNNGIPVRMHGFEFGKASGMAPRAR